MHIRIQHEAFLASIPSGSGIEVGGNHFYLVGDDSNKLYQLDHAWNITQAITLFEPDADEWVGNRLLKKRKPDLEAMAWYRHHGKDGLLMLGSGSREKKRNKAFWVPVSESGKMGEAEKIDMKPLYTRLREESAIHELNIEAAATLPEGLLLINRGGIFQPNTLIHVENPFREATDYRLYSILTPPINGTASGISGATYLPQSDTLLLSLSAEVTDDSVNDGEIHGSALGVIHQVKQRLKSGNWALDDFALIPTDAPQKVESVAVIAIHPGGKMEMISVADNDDGTSRLFSLEITV